MMGLDTIRVLLIEDDEDDYFLVKELLGEIKACVHELDWEKTYEAGLASALHNNHDVCLIDYRLGARNGVELLEAALAGECAAPMILLTGMGQHEVDVAAMKVGAADYLVKGRLDANQLERSIRYAVERKRAAAEAAFEQARLAAFGAQIGLVLTQPESFLVILEKCAQAMVQYLNGAVAQIWVSDPAQPAPETQKRARTFFKILNSHLNVPLPDLNLKDIALGKPVLIKPLKGDIRLRDQSWVGRENINSFAAHPLMIGDRLVGLMGLYSREMLTESVLQEMGSVASGIALCIQRKQAEEALDATEGKYRHVVENIREVIYQMDGFGHWTFLNPAWTSATGFSAEESTGTFFLDYIHYDDRSQNRHVFLQLMERKLDYCRYETRFLTKDGKVRWMEVYMELMLDASGEVSGLSGSLNDTTERKATEIEIQKLAAFPRVNPDPVLEFAANASLSYSNDAAQQMVNSLGVADVLALLPPDALQIVRECVASGQKRLRRQVVVNGRSLSWSFFPVTGNQVVHCYGADITDIVNLEAQFRHAQKLESVGQMAAGVAHDFNNILTVVQGYATLLLAHCENDPKAVKQLKVIADAARRAARLTQQLLAFSRKQVIQPKVLDLNSVLQNLTAMLTRLLGEDISLQTNLLSGLPPIEADAGMIEQVVMNLAVNARDAMPKGGQLLITTTVVEVDAETAEQHVGAQAGRFTCLHVSDTGSGMSEDTLAHLFEPFFTTKEFGKGTGLGLATVYGIVRQHHGWIDVASKIGVGTTFKIMLPAAARAAEDTADTTILCRDIKGGCETLLIVEDELDVREMAREILRGQNYRVVEAANGIEALKVWDEHDGRFDLLLTDIVMPEGLGGQELATQLRKREPGLKVVFTSGYSPALLTQGHRWYLQKPYNPSALADLVRKCLDSAPSLS